MEITRAERLTLASRIMAGLLASGHYTDPNNGQPFLLYEKDKEDQPFKVMEDTLDLLFELEEQLPSHAA